MINRLNNSVNNNFNKDSARQAKSQKQNNFLSVVNLAPVLQWLQNPSAFFMLRANRRLAKLVNYLVALANFNEVLYPTQGTIAKSIDVGRQRTNQLIARAVSLGIITKKWRAFTSCIYELHPIFNMLPFRQKLMKIMPSLWYLPLVLLAVLNRSDRCSDTKYATLQIKNKPLYKKPLPLSLSDAYVYHVFTDKYNRRHITLYSKSPHRRVMEQEAAKQSIFKESVLEASRLMPLTDAGRCNISAYDDNVIYETIIRIRGYRKRIGSIYGMFIKVCNTVAAESKLLPDRSISYQLASALGVRLGVDANIIEGKPSLLLQQQEGAKSSSPQHKQFAAKSARSYSSNTNTRPAQQSSNGEWNLTKLQELNEGIDLSLASFVGTNTLHVPTPNYDSTHRQTTQAERDIWNESRRLLMESERGKIAAAMGLVMPEAPMWFNGDCNVPASRNFIIQPDGALILPGMTPEQTRLITAPFLRPLTEKEVEHAAWLATYISESQKPAPSWYTSLLVDIEKRGDNLEKKLELYREALENERAQALKSSAKDS